MQQLRELTARLERLSLGSGSEFTIASLLRQVEMYERTLTGVDEEIKKLVNYVEALNKFYGDKRVWRSGISRDAIMRFYDRKNAKYEGV